MERRSTDGRVRSAAALGDWFPALLLIAQMSAVGWLLREVDR
jgi:nitrate reductase gamma subunit